MFNTITKRITWMIYTKIDILNEKIPRYLCHSERSEESIFGVMGLYYVYILSTWNNEVIYTGVTNDLQRRMYEHKNKLVDGFTKKYNINKLVYYEDTTDVRSAIKREKQIKGWTRQKKNELVKMVNSKWEDLSEQWYEGKDSSLRSE